MKHKLKNERGYTLQELLVAIPLGMLILAGVTTTFVSQSRSYHAQEQINEMQQNARAAMDIMVREIKMAGYNPMGAAAFDNGIPDLTKYEVLADLNDDGDMDDLVTDDPNEKITYTFQDDPTRQIFRDINDGNGPQLLAENIDDLTITYLEDDGVTVATNVADVRQVKIDITARTRNPDPNFLTNGGIRTYNITSFVTPPNLDF